jgi:HD superfamily phosphohydrolase
MVLTSQRVLGRVVCRGLRQLGTAHYVFPGAKHSRWEHSLGVMHLAGKFLEHLRKDFHNITYKKYPVPVSSLLFNYSAKFDHPL